MPTKTSSKTNSASEPFSLIPRNIQRALYERVSQALQNRNGDESHNDVAEIAAAMALRASDVVVAADESAGVHSFRPVARPGANANNALLGSISEAVQGLCSAPSDAVALIATPLPVHKELRQTISFLGRTKLPLIILTKTVVGKKGKAFDLRTIHAEFGVPVITVDANDAIAVYRVVTEAAHNSRVGRGTSIIEATLIGTSKKIVASPSPLECLESYMRRHGAWPQK